MKAYIVAAGEYCKTIDDADQLQVLKPLVREATGRSVRRISRFIELALIGAGRAGAQRSDNTAVYFSSGRADIEITAKVLDGLYRRNEAPMPLTFINTVSNAATFYVAQCLGLQGASSFITSRYFSLEMGLKSACFDLSRGRIESALVGAVDIVALPLSAHRQRLGIAATTPVAEASHWLQLVAKPGQQTVLASVESIQQFPNRQLLSSWFKQQNFEAATQLAIGQYMDDEEAEQWLAETKLPPFLYRHNIGHFDSQVGRALCQFVNSDTAALVHINRDPRGRYMAMVLKR